MFTFFFSEVCFFFFFFQNFSYFSFVTFVETRFEEKKQEKIKYFFFSESVQKMDTETVLKMFIYYIESYLAVLRYYSDIIQTHYAYQILIL